MLGTHYTLNARVDAGQKVSVNYVISYAQLEDLTSIAKSYKETIIKRFLDDYDECLSWKEQNYLLLYNTPLLRK